MATKTCTDLVIHPDFKPDYLSAIHSKTSFATALKNLANKQTFIFKPIQPTSVSATASHTYVESRTSHQRYWTL